MSSETSDKVRRKLRAALKRAVSFWNQIRLMLASHDAVQDSASLTDQFRRFNAEVCRELETQPHGTKRTHQIAEAMQLSHQQLKSVAEVFNPGCFGKRAKAHQLNAGYAFDIALGLDLLKPRNQNEVRNYLRHVKPGLVTVAPPCKSFSSLQNLSMNRREESTELMQRYLQNRKQGRDLLAFGVEVCHMCIQLGLKFVFEHPANATSWQERCLSKLAKLPGVHSCKTDQCAFGLHGDQGLHRKPTRFISNSPEIIAALDRQCSKDHAHEPIVGGGRSLRSQAYPERLIDAILAAYRRLIGRSLKQVSWCDIDRENH